MSVTASRRFSVLAASLLIAGGITSVAQAQFGPAKVTVSEVRLVEGVSTGRAFVGSVEARRRSSVGAAVGGRVVEFLVNEGDRVEKNQPLAELLTGNVKIQIAAAKAENELRVQELLEHQNGARVEERQHAESGMKAAGAAMKYAQSKLGRTKKLMASGASTNDQLDDDTTAADAASDMYLAAKATYDLVIAGSRKEKIAQAEARVSAATEEVNRLEDILKKHTIRSPFAGYVVAEHTEEGQWIESGKLVAEVVEVDPIEIRVQVLESYVSKLTLGMSARIDIEALSGETFVGKIIAIVPKADEKSRSFPVKIELQNREQTDGTPVVKPGMFARVWLPVDQKSNVLLVPKDSLVLGGPTPMVYVVELDAKDKKSKARPVPVQLGIAAESWIEVRGDLQPGQSIVVEGNERLRPGAEVLASPANVKAPPVVAAPPMRTLPERLSEREAKGG